MNENEINVTTTCIMALANQPNAEEKIKLLLANLFACYPQKDNFDVQSNSNSQTISTSITFTQKEIEKMATTFKKQFIANGLVAHVLKKPCGKNTFSYEIRIVQMPLTYALLRQVYARSNGLGKIPTLTP